jgi:Phosphotransferase enzyme family
VAVHVSDGKPASTSRHTPTSAHAPTSPHNPSSPQTPTSEYTPGVNYRQTSKRFRYEDLSPAVREAADVVLGSPVVRAWSPVTSGFTNAYAGRVLLRDGRQAFLKATGPQFPWPVRALSREAQVLEALGEHIPAVPMIGTGSSSDGGRVLALEWVDGNLPGFPWTDDEIALVRDACEQVADVPASALATLAPGRVADSILGIDTLRMARTTGLPLPGSLERLPAWLPARMSEVTALACDADALRDSDQSEHLNHFDLRPDNLLIGRRAGEVADRAYVLDWNWVTLGPPWCDWVGLVPSMQAQGYDLAGLLDSSPLSRTADPHALNVFLAQIAVFMLSDLDDQPPPGLTLAIRHHQRYYARIFLDTLATHRGWL